MNKQMNNNKAELAVMGVAITSLAFIAVALSSSHVSADDSIVDDVSITVPVACSMGGTITTGQEHTATLQPGTYSGASGSEYENGIGTTTLTTFCNDFNGFSIYAIGYTGETDGDNTLVGTSTSGNATIPTKVYQSGDTTSNWSMKVNKITDSTVSYNPANMNIDNSFDSWHTVPDDYVRVAHYKATTEGASSTTDSGTGALGAKVTTTYAAYISTTQPADTYTGKVKYVMVHPYMQDDSNKPEKKMPQSSCPTSPMLSTVVPGITYMQDINSSNKSTVLSAISTGDTYQIKDSRDNEIYCVGKLQDGNLWLLDNLALDLTNSTILNSLSADNTNINTTTDPGALAALKGTTVRDPNTDSTGKYATAGVTNWTSGSIYSAPLVNLTNKDVIPTDTTSASGGYKVGGYYNYCAASAGSYCYGNGTSWGTSSGNATSDICPKGWRMPTGNTSGEYQTLYNNSNYNTYANYRSALRLPLSGYFYFGTAINQGSYGYFWSSTRNDNYYMYDLNVYSSSIYPANGNDSRSGGYSVRCVLGS